MGKKVLIVGGVAGGASAAARLRRLDEEAEIILFERGDYISFANCGLPYYIGGAIKDRSKLLVQTKDGMETRFNIDIRLNSEVKAIDKASKEVTVEYKGEIYKESYDYLLLSPGAYPFVPPIKGINGEGIFSLRNMADVDRIKGHILNNKPKTAAVIGAGFVGVEMAENLKEAGIDVYLIEAANQVMVPFDIEMSRIIEKTLNDNGIKIILNDAVDEFIWDESIDIVLKSGCIIKVDTVITAIGVKPEMNLAKEAGLRIGNRGGIEVDDHMKTSDPYIYAVGDAVEVVDFINGNKTLIPLAGPANKQGRIAADNIAGRDVKYNGTQGTSIIKVFNIAAASTGNNEKTLKKLGIPYEKSYTISASHAGYYKGASMMTVKLIFSPDTGRILGAQIIGEDGVDKRIDVLAAAVRHGLTAFDLEELELAYAPPYSSAKDPINMAGFTAANILKGDMKVIHWDKLDEINSDEYVVLDVRTPLELQGGYIKGALNVPVDEIRDRVNEIPKGKKILIYCKIGLRGYIAYRILTQMGFDAVNLSGGYTVYALGNYKAQGTEKKSSCSGCGCKSNSSCCRGEDEKLLILRIEKGLQEKIKDDVIQINVSDEASLDILDRWSRETGNTLLGTEKSCCAITVYIKKGND